MNTDSVSCATGIPDNRLAFDINSPCIAGATLATSAGYQVQACRRDTFAAIAFTHISGLVYTGGYACI
tara:strand:+ start:124 stop:327 length:204 start_codon:yes stop_codon:yes gene_type:complete